jgi:hypothetical protein
MSPRAKYEAAGYAARTWWLASCPYADGWQRDAWQVGAWRWQQEQRGKR